MEEWDLLRIYHPFEFRGTNGHTMVIESTDTNEVSFIYSYLRQLLKYPESYVVQISREKHVAEISLYEFTTDNISEYAYQDNKKKKDRPYERDLYWGVFVLIRSRGWKPYGERGLFIRYKEAVVNEE